MRRRNSAPGSLLVASVIAPCPDASVSASIHLYLPNLAPCLDTLSMRLPFSSDLGLRKSKSSGFVAYATSNLYKLMAAREMARRLQDKGVLVVACQPVRGSLVPKRRETTSLPHRRRRGV
jgi:NAD(P)-dependent dehydrogenase (short-subunit alcohol dehydrogenase family)